MRLQRRRLQMSLRMTEVDLHINIKFNNKVFLTPQSAELLRKVQQTGSLNAASKAISISYQNAWTLIEDMNNTASSPLLVKQRGGSGGGGAVLTEYGNLIIKDYTFIEQQVAKFCKQLNTEISL